MKPQRTKGTFNRALIDKCRQFAQNSLPTSVDQYARRGQDPAKHHRQIIQLTNGKLGEELAYATYLSYFPQLSPPDYGIYDKGDKSWVPDLTDTKSGVRIAVKTKDARDAKQWGASWIFEKTDRKIFGESQDDNQYVCCVIVDQPRKSGEVVACVKLGWLHDKQLFTQPDRDYLGTKLTVRLENMVKAIAEPMELWQL